MVTSLELLAQCIGFIALGFAASFGFSIGIYVVSCWTIELWRSWRNR